MNRFGLYGLAAAMSIAASIILWGGWWNTNPPPWESPKYGTFYSNNGSICWIDYQDRASLLYFPGNWTPSTSHTSNPATKTFNYTGGIRVTEAENPVDLRYQFVSNHPNQIVINDTPYNLAQGEVFIVNSQGQMEQLPVRPLKPYKENLGALATYLKSISK